MRRAILFHEDKHQPTIIMPLSLIGYETLRRSFLMIEIMLESTKPCDEFGEQASK